MAALTAAKAIVKVDGPEFLRKVPVAADVVIYHGAMVGKTSGYAVPAATGADKVIGVANLEAWDDQTAGGQASVQNRTSGNKVDTTSLSNGDRHIVVEMGTFKFQNKSGDLVDETMIGDTAYVENDQTVRKTGAGTIAAGILVGFDDDGLPLVQVPSSAFGRI